METDRRGIDVVEGERCAEDACAVNRADAFPSAARELGDGISQIGVFTEGEDQRNLGEFSHFLFLFLLLLLPPFPFSSSVPRFLLRSSFPTSRSVPKSFLENRRQSPARNVLLTHFENTRFRGRGRGRKSIPKVMFFSCSVWKMSHSRGRFRKLRCFR